MISRNKIGFVIKISLNKTITVVTERKYSDKKYGKTVTKHKKYMVHDENNICNVGDIITFINSRPYSKNKKWILNYKIT